MAQGPLWKKVSPSGPEQVGIGKVTFPSQKDSKGKQDPGYTKMGRPAAK